MNPFQKVVDKLNPIPPEHKSLETTYYEEGLSTLQKIVAGMGFIMLFMYFSQIVAFILFGDPNADKLIDVILFSSITNVIVPVIWIYIGFKTLNRKLIYWLVFLGTLFFLSQNLYAIPRVSDPYLAVYGPTFMTIPIISLIPWPTSWALRSQLGILVFDIISYLAIQLFAQSNEASDLTTAIAAWLTLFLFVFIHAFLNRQRWDSFFNRHQVQLLTDQLQEELALAKEIQKSLLPSTSPNWPHLEVACFSQAAQQVGGDFYQYHAYPVDEGEAKEEKYVIAVGDVSGKGVSAALLMAASLSQLDAYLSSNRPLNKLMVELDKAIMPYTKPRKQNCALCYLEISRLPASAQNNTFHWTLQIGNAGGIPPYIKKGDGSIVWPEIGGFALGQGLGSEFGYQTVEISLSKGDIIILTSDGVVEAYNINNEIFGFDRLEQTIANAPIHSAKTMLTHLQNVIQTFIGVAEPHDDITIVVVQV